MGLFRQLTLMIALTALTLTAQTIPEQLPDPDGKPGAKDKPVKVYILSGQSNMVGMGDISGGFTRIGKEVIDPVVSVYEGAYDPEKDYDKATAINSLKLEQFGGVKPTPFPEGDCHVVRGQVKVKATGVYEFKPGYGNSTYAIMTIDGKEVYRKMSGDKDSQRTGIKLEGDKAYPFKVIFTTKNASGLMWFGRTDIPGTLNTLVKQQGKFPHLIDDQGNWTVRNDVIYKGVISAKGQGPMTVGIQGNTIGPELQFGYIMGHYHDEPVLILKSSIGNRSMGWDILPPGSKRYEYDGKIYAGYKDSPASWDKGTKPEPINWYAGKQYDDYTKAIHDVLNNFDKLFPQFKDQGYEIAGFVWWQGHKDGGSEAHISRYEENLANLIKAWRKEFKAPKAPWAIATVGFDGDKMQENYIKILEAQMALADPEKHPEFAGNVTTVDIRKFWRGVEESPKSQGFHYNRNAETYLMVGDVLGRAMVKMKEGK